MISVISGNVVGEDYQKSTDLDSKDYSWNHSIYVSEIRSSQSYADLRLELACMVVK